MTTFTLDAPHAREWLTRVVVTNELGECSPEPQLLASPPEEMPRLGDNPSRPRRAAAWVRSRTAISAS